MAQLTRRGTIALFVSPSKNQPFFNGLLEQVRCSDFSKPIGQFPQVLPWASPVCRRLRRRALPGASSPRVWCQWRVQGSNSTAEASRKCPALRLGLSLGRALPREPMRGLASSPAGRAAACGFQEKLDKGRKIPVSSLPASCCRASGKCHGHLAGKSLCRHRLPRLAREAQRTGPARFVNRQPVTECLRT